MDGRPWLPGSSRATASLSTRILMGAEEVLDAEHRPKTGNELEVP